MVRIAPVMAEVFRDIMVTEAPEGMVAIFVAGSVHQASDNGNMPPIIIGWLDP